MNTPFIVLILSAILLAALSYAVISFRRAEVAGDDTNPVDATGEEAWREDWSFGENVRIDAGPRRRVEIATEVLLDNAVTAGHYQVGSLDSLGQPIELGKPMNFIDWKGSDLEFTVYRFIEGRWQPQARFDAEQDAINAALALSKE